MRVYNLIALSSSLLYLCTADVLAVKGSSDSLVTTSVSTSDSSLSGKKNIASNFNPVVGSTEELVPAVKSNLAATSKEDDESNSGASNPLVMSVSMIIVSEIGDKTFLIAALMAMKASRIRVFTAAFAALAIMTILSGIVGHTLPALIPQRYTQFLAGVLFVVFGYKLLREGLAMSKDIGVDEEMAEVEEEIAMNDMNHRMETQESGGMSAPKKTAVQEALDAVKNFFAFALSPIWIQVFVMTFLGEWGDRSQIATIAMAAGSDYWLVILGAIIGHGICTGGAVLGGKLLATRISMRNVTLGGSIAFFIFAILYFYDAFRGGEQEA